MTRTARCLALLSLLGSTLACEAAAPTAPEMPETPDSAGSGPSLEWPVPSGWKHETFALPPGFAPEFPYHGTEDLRFMPGFSEPTAPDYWSYEFVWWLDEQPRFDATSIAAALTTYFRGLSTAVGGSKYQFDPARYRADLTVVPGSAPPRMAGQVYTYDPFTTGLPLILNLEVELRSCPATSRTPIVVVLSPQHTTNPVWTELRATAAALTCPSPAPVVFGEGVVSTGEYESHPAFTPDGRTLYFVRSTPEFTDWTIYVTEHADGRWSTPKVAPFSGQHRDADPFISADAQQLYFISDRPVDGRPKQDMDIWVMDRAQDGAWGEPRNLGAPVNTTGSEWFPTLAADGSLYFGSDRPGGRGNTDLYRAGRAEGGFAEPQNLGPNVNSAAEEYEGCISPDESFLVFMAVGRPDGLGGGDLHVSYRKDGEWTPAKNLGPTVNGPGLEISPYLSPDGKSFFFSSARAVGSIPAGARPDRAGNGLGDIYEMDLGALHALAE